MNSSYYKYCIVPQCKSTTIKTPNKLFIYVPNNEQIRKKWLKLARRDDVHNLSTNSRMYFCEDHFDLPNDMVNYIEYHVMGTVSQVRMKPGCMPSKFECQENRRKPTCNSTERLHTLKKQRIMTTKECLNEPEQSCTPSSSLKDTSDTSSNNAALNKGGQNQKDKQAMLVDKEAQNSKASHICNGCKRNIFGVRYKCVQCSDYDVCAACEARGVHALHYALRVPEHSMQDEVLRVIEAIKKCLNEDPSAIMVAEVKEEVIEELVIKEEPSDVEESDPLSTLEEQEVPQGSGREQIEIDLKYTHSSQQAVTANAGSVDTPHTASPQLTNTAAHYYGQMASRLDENFASDMESKPHNVAMSSTSREKINLTLAEKYVDSCRSSKLMRTSEQLKPTKEVRSPDHKIQLSKRSLPSDERASSLKQPLKIKCEKIAMSSDEPTDTEIDKHQKT